MRFTIRRQNADDGGGGGGDGDDDSSPSFVFTFKRPRGGGEAEEEGEKGRVASKPMKRPMKGALHLSLAQHSCAGARASLLKGDTVAMARPARGSF